LQSNGSRTAIESWVSYLSHLCHVTVSDQVVWLSGLHIPESYLTAIVQATCRRHGWPLDKSTLFTSVTSFQTADELLDSEDAYGHFVQGLYLEGAGWNVERNCLVKQKPKQLIQVSQMPYYYYYYY